MLHPTVLGKQTDRQVYFHITSTQLQALKKTLKRKKTVDLM